jgi:hypothetical protein
MFCIRSSAVVGGWAAHSDGKKQGVSPWRARARVALASQGWSISRRLPVAEAIACRSVSSELTTRS